MRVLVTGSRDWVDETVVHEALWSQAVRTGVGRAEFVVVHGHCPSGADAIAHAWAKRMGCVVEPHRAAWNAHGNQAGRIRNAKMIKLGADICLAFINPCTKPECATQPGHGSHGTTNCAMLAHNAGIEVVYFYGE